MLLQWVHRCTQVMTAAEVLEKMIRFPGYFSGTGAKKELPSPYTDSADTVRFVLYRAEAVGARPYGKPEPIASLDFDKPDERERACPGHWMDPDSLKEE